MRVGSRVRCVEFVFREVALFIEVERDLKFFGQVFCFLVIFDPFLFRPQVLYVNLGFFGVVPEIGCKGFFFFVGDFDELGIYVKDTSSALQGALQYL